MEIWIAFVVVFVVALGVQAGLAAIVASLAKKRGKSPAAYFWLSFFLTFLVGILVLLVQTSGGQTVRKLGPDSRLGVLNGEQVLKCPKCAEWIKVEATVCKHCGQDVAEHVRSTLSDVYEKSVAMSRDAEEQSRVVEAKKRERRRAFFRNRAVQAGAVVVVASIGIVSFLSVSRSNEVADVKAPAKVLSASIDSAAGPQFCPVIKLTFDVSGNEARKALIASEEPKDPVDFYDGKDFYRIEFYGQSDLAAGDFRQLISPSQSLLSGDGQGTECTRLALDYDNSIDYEIFANNYWTERVLVFSGSFEVPWKTPNYTAKHDEDNIENDIELLPANFESSATEIRFEGLSDEEVALETDRYRQYGSVWVDEGQTYTVELINPAGSQKIEIRYGM
jgi:hypothetical protein